MSVQVQHRRDSNGIIEGVTPAVAELGFDTTKKEALIGDGATAGGVRLAKKNIRETLSPAQITSNQNNYNPTGLKHAGVLLVTTDASRNLTGMVPSTATDTTDGRTIEIYNSGSFNLVVQDQNGSSTAANRFDLGGADITIGPKQSLVLRYNLTTTRWEIGGGNYGQAIADGSVSARKLAASALGARVGMINGTLAESHAGNAVTFALKTMAGTDPSAADPVYVVFNNGSGGFVVRTITAALALTISSGSSMGVSSGITFRLWLVLVDTGSTAVLGAVNCLSGTNVMALPEYAAYSSTAEGGAGAADVAQTIYTAAAQSSKYLCLAGFADYDSGLVTAGAWAVSPSRLVLFGPGVPRPGEVVSSVRNEDGGLATGATLIPFDDTIPQNTEGNAYLQANYTPSSACNLLIIEAQAIVAYSVLSTVSMALFRDSVANALKAVLQYMDTANGNRLLQLRTAVLAASVVVTAFKVRVGGHNAGTISVNGAASARTFGGVMNSYVEVTEIMG